jgi:DNA (cytosine-5)-methyltransferase 1
VSIRKDIDNGSFKFPEGFPLELRLKDMLEDEVSGKYYIHNPNAVSGLCNLNNRVTGILSNQATVFENETEVANTLLARDYKGFGNQGMNCVVEPVRLGNIYGQHCGTGFAGNVWDKEAICPTLMTMQGGNRQPMITVDNKG